MSQINEVSRLEETAEKFKVKGNILSVKAFGSGHINDTLRVETINDNKQSYLLQRINHHVFPNVEGLMNNILLVTQHLQSKIAAVDKSLCDTHVLTLVLTKDDKLYYQDENGDYWRMFLLIEDTRSYDIVETSQQAFEGGRAFGIFQKQLADLDAGKIVEVIPNFHNIQFRLSNLQKAIEANPLNRVEGVQDLLDYIAARAEKMKTILNWGNSGLLPLRITHNDTKFNNVLLDKNDKVQCVIDLDTVMPGYVAYDFGDAIRTIINPVAEDEKDTSKIKLLLGLYEAFAEGYLSEAKEFLTDKECESLVEGVFLFPYMQGVRFLTDYLEGDHYFKTNYEDHNLVRAKTQFKLVEEMEKNATLLRDIVCKYK